MTAYSPRSLFLFLLQRAGVFARVPTSPSRFRYQSIGKAARGCHTVQAFRWSRDALAMQPSEVFVGSIDQGTTSTRFLIFNREGEPVASHQVEFPQIYPKSGWHEHNPLDLVSSVETCVEKAVKQFESTGFSRNDIKAVGITNQRETTVVWDYETGEPLCNAIVWTDTRSQAIVNELKEKPGASRLQQVCGLPLSTYSSSSKLLWMLANVPRVKDAYERGTLAFGTIDTWLVYCLNGGRQANVFVSDPTNASRTMFMNLETLEYDNSLLDFFDIRGRVHLPKIVPSSDTKAYGVISDGILAGVPIMGCSAISPRLLSVRRGSHQEWQRTHTAQGVFSLAYHFDGKPVYALEGSIAVGGSGVKFLQNNLEFFKESQEINDLALTVEDNGGCVFVTAFSGLFAPYWIDDAKGTIFGITQYTKKGHIARATLEATCFQTKAILDAMEKDSGHALSELAVDGGMSNSDLAMQTQADLISIPVYRPKMRETTALGAAIAAGLAVGLWRNFAELRDINRSGGAVFEPRVSRQESAESFALWEKAVNMSRGWVGNKVPPAAPETKKDAPVAVQHSENTQMVPAKVNGSILPAKRPLLSISSDLDDADEDYLYLELRRVEILQRLKKLTKLKVALLST
ncbi:glycerol kinase [Aspergillus bombycis]|uniref:glycerol kinase n=1 Tax=Aspergillus bombycis TaxID=109264 RepID=A0A1F8AGP1_9EURO|nr:glycerol kinase [Aspergillus bombycis]OGM50488.1 glycerol kinase [Aspergillus bombycis]